MNKNKTFLAIIPARGGSKRLPRKNVLELCGKPLIAWSIEAALKSKYLDKVIVSSDDEEILNISKKIRAKFTLPFIVYQILNMFMFNISKFYMQFFSKSCCNFF